MKQIQRNFDRLEERKKKKERERGRKEKIQVKREEGRSIIYY